VDPAQLQTAIEIVLRAGEIQLARLGHDVEINKKGVIDLVTQVDVEVETMGRELIGERFPTHTVLARSCRTSPSRRGRRRGIRGSSIRSTGP
jgi:myo-inositol-1(or 4)-monophosphatase